VSEDADDKPADAGLPAWVMTFADLMSLLMCFFVLLLSFSEMDLQKFKQVAGSMDKAFGVQRQIKVMAAPRGTSLIAQEFSPGKPEPTPVNEIKQSTTDRLEEMLKIQQSQHQMDSNASNKVGDVVSQKSDEQAAETAADTQMIAEYLIDEISSGELELETSDNKIIIRILEKGSFLSGSADLQKKFLPVLVKVSNVLEDIPGQITVAGFTDDIPMQNNIFSSNWELSAARAFSVMKVLLQNVKLETKRFVLSGFASNNALLPNSSVKNRAKNRRVEIIVLQGDVLEEDPADLIEIEEQSDVNFLNDIIDEDDEFESTFPFKFDELKDDGYSNGNDDFESGRTRAKRAKPIDLEVFDENSLYDYEYKKPSKNK